MNRSSCRYLLSVTQPWPEAENLTEAELAREEQDLEETMRLLMLDPRTTKRRLKAVSASPARRPADRPR